jgi:hypothetical protein
MRGFVPEEGTEIDVEYTISKTRTIYVPADRSGDWIEDNSAGERVIDVSLPEWTDEIEKEQLSSGGAGMPDVVAHPRGRVTGGDGWETHYYHVSPLSRLYDEMPVLTAPVDFNLAPADLRAAMFQALALLPGARVISENGDLTTIAVPDGGESNWLETVTIDTGRGLMVGRGSLDMPESQAWLDISIVDSAPEGVHLQPEG